MSDPNDWMRNYVRYSSIILQLVVTIVVGVFLGYKVDHWMGLGKPVFLIIFTIVFSVLSFYIAIKEIIRKK
jgi:F0F1-type ATP synthase assembly protein I